MTPRIDREDSDAMIAATLKVVEVSRYADGIEATVIGDGIAVVDVSDWWLIPGRVWCVDVGGPTAKLTLLNVASMPRKRGPMRDLVARYQVEIEPVPVRETAGELVEV